MAQALFGIALALCLGLSVANAQTTRQNPSWGQLTPDEQQILAPIKAEWDKLDAPRKRKWIGIAQRYPKMKPEEQTRLQKRMQEWASLTPDQRRAAREKYKEFEQLPAEERQAVREKWDKYRQEAAQKSAPAPSPAAAPEPATPVESVAANGAPPDAATLQPQQ
jgi:hypothetical protein